MEMDIPVKSSEMPSSSRTKPVSTVERRLAQVHRGTILNGSKEIMAIGLHFGLSRSQINTQILPTLSRFLKSIDAKKPRLSTTVIPCACILIHFKCQETGVAVSLRDLFLFSKCKIPLKLLDQVKQFLDHHKSVSMDASRFFDMLIHRCQFDLPESILIKLVDRCHLFYNLLKSVNNISFFEHPLLTASTIVILTLISCANEFRNGSIDIKDVVADEKIDSFILCESKSSGPSALCNHVASIYRVATGKIDIRLRAWAQIITDKYENDSLLVEGLNIWQFVAMEETMSHIFAA